MNKKPSWIQWSAWVLLCLSIVFLILTVSIGLPIYCRFFYYLHIDALDMPGNTGLTAQQIRQAYDAVLDYLTIPGKPFSTGVLPYSQEGMAHFADCKVLFDLNAIVLLISATLTAALLLLRRAGILRAVRPLGRGAGFWAGVFAIVLPLALGGLAATDFNRAFEIFHKIFFPGKSNWIFDPRFDPVINIMPQVFFRNCALLIGAGVVVLSLTLIIFDLVKNRKTAPVRR